MTEKGTVARSRIDKQLRAAVIRGVRLLDRRDPYWWNGKNTPAAINGMVGHIDLEKMDMASGNSCVIGQRSVGHYEIGVSVLGLWRSGEAAHGFNRPQSADVEREFSLLTELWASVIQSRRYPRRKIASDPWVKKANETWRRA